MYGDVHGPVVIFDWLVKLAVIAAVVWNKLCTFHLSWDALIPVVVYPMHIVLVFMRGAVLGWLCMCDMQVCVE